MSTPPTFALRAWPQARLVRLLLISGLVLALGLAVTFGLWQAARQDLRRAQADELRSWTGRLAYAISDRIGGYVQVLGGVAGLFEASPEVTGEAFRRYWKALDLEQRHPGILGLGFAALVPAGAGPDQGADPADAAVRFIELPTDRNRRALGHDLAADPALWAAAERARDLGVATLSGNAAPDQGDAADTQPGMVLVLPVYRPGAARDTLAERRANLLGWAYAPVSLDRLMQGVLASLGFAQLQGSLRLEVYDGDPAGADKPLAAVGPSAAAGGSDPALRLIRGLDLEGHRWTLVAQANPGFAIRGRTDQATLVALSGGALSLLLALLIAGQGIGRVCLAAALAESKRTGRQLAERERDLLWAQRTAQLGSWSYDPKTRTMTWSEGVYRIWDLEPGQGAPDFEAHRLLIHPDDWQRFEGALGDAVELGQPFRLELRIRRQDGQSGHVLSMCTPESAPGRAERIFGTVQDITEQVRLRDALREQAIRDPLTDLFNRRFLDETLPRELARCARLGEPLVVAMLDLDHFKGFNDRYGHDAGDQALRAVGTLLRSRLRGADLACRYGGEELTLILPGASLVDARARLDGLRQAIMGLPIRYRDGMLPAPTVSVGLAVSDAGAGDPAALLARADEALYLAKARGRNRVVAAEIDDPLDPEVARRSERVRMPLVRMLREFAEAKAA